MVGQWWTERATREKVALIVAALAVVATTVYLVLEPMVEQRQRLAREIPEMRKDISWMRSHLEEVRRLRAGSPAGDQSPEGGLTPAMVERSLESAGLAEKLKGLRPEGDGVRLVFEQVAFADLLEWLASFRRQNAAVAKGARIERGDQARGRVEARLSLAPPGADQ